VPRVGEFGANFVPGFGKMLNGMRRSLAVGLLEVTVTEKGFGGIPLI
jgi:hypothetical protein